MYKDKSANYDFCVQNQPKKRMGMGSFANLPDKPIMLPYGAPTYRGGNVNSFSASIRELSGIDENQR